MGCGRYEMLGMPLIAAERREDERQGDGTRSAIQAETLLETETAWDGQAYVTYPEGRPQITVMRFTLPPHTTMPWHTHPRIATGYVLAGSFSIEKPDGTRQTYREGEAVSETVNEVHRGTTGAEGVILVAFFAGSAGVPLSDPGPEHEAGA